MKLKWLTAAALPLGLVVLVQAADIHLAQGSFCSEVTTTTALLQTRLTAIPGPALAGGGDVPGAFGTVRFEYSATPDFRDARQTEWINVNAEADFIARAQLTQLEPGKRYYYRARFGTARERAQPGATGQFSTLPGAGSEQGLTFIVGSCMNYHKFMHGVNAKPSGPVTATEKDKQLGYPAVAAMLELKPDFFVGTGDMVYYDQTARGPAGTLAELRQCWHEQFRFPRLIDFFARTPAYWSKDDHDFRFNDSDNLGDALPSPRTGIEVFREQMPMHPAGDRTAPTYRTHRVNRHVQIWLTEGRDFRSPNKMPDGPEKTLWGREQRAWLQRTLQESDATWKILISPTPLVGPDDAYKTDNHVNPAGFRHEADAFFAWLGANGITGFMTFCGDRHWQYHSIHPTGVEEFGCGAMNDENSRAGVAPGSQKGTDPEARIRQPFTYAKPAGGFIRVRVGGANGDPSRLVIEHRDTTGKVLNTVTKMAARK